MSPTFASSARFWQAYHRLARRDQQAFLRAKDVFVEDLKAGRAPRPSLGIRPFVGRRGWWEFHFGANLRALFTYGEDTEHGRHVEWQDIGTHAIYQRNQRQR